RIPRWHGSMTSRRFALPRSICRKSRPLSSIVVPDLIVAIAMGTADGAFVAARQPQLPALAQLGVITRHAGGERALECRLTGGGAIALRRQRPRRKWRLD